MKNEDIVRLYAMIEGRVQGVGFRYFVATKTQNTAITGWVRNTFEGNVEVLAEGPQTQLVQFARHIQCGPPSAYVTQAKIDWREASGEFTRFEVRSTA